MKADGKRAQIAAACASLLEKTSLEALRTQDLIAAAGVSRSAFYRLFLDKYEVANWIYRSETEKLIREMPRLSDWKQWTLALHAYMRAHAAFFRNIAGYSGQNSFEEFLHQYFSGNVMRTRADAGSPLSDEQRFAVDAFSLIGARTTVEWIRAGFRPDDETLLRRLDACIPACIRPFYEAEETRKI